MEEYKDLKSDEKPTTTKVIVKANYSCKHYLRNCKFYAPCCNKLYRCRFCHDEGESHKFDRKSVNRIQCSHCQTSQPLQQDCSNCGICFGKYFCATCKLFDNADGKPQFHCDGCGICRIGPKDDFFHCQTCNMCLPIGLDRNHKCIKDVSRGDCPVCLDDIHTSRESSQIPPCHHLIHKSCYKKLIQNQIYSCPICSRSFGSLVSLWKVYDDQIQRCPLPEDYNGLYVSALCRDCRSDNNVPFHFFGLKCTQCGSYNTVRNKGPFLRRSEDEWVEFDPSEIGAVNQSSSDPWEDVSTDEANHQAAEAGEHGASGDENASESSNEDCDNQSEVVEVDTNSVPSSKPEIVTVERHTSQPEE